jgi:hypothetical protein
MRQRDSVERARTWVVDYSAARAKAIEWLGERYLLAKPINRRFGARDHPREQTPTLTTHRLECATD